MVSEDRPADLKQLVIRGGEFKHVVVRLREVFWYALVRAIDVRGEMKNRERDQNRTE